MYIHEKILSHLDKKLSTQIRVKMDDLISVMQIIDRYSDKFTEGDYLQLCGK